MAKRQGETERHAKILREAKERFRRCQNWETTCRARFVDDVKFCEGDSDNLFQWPEDIRSRMDDDKRAMLTINKTRQHVLDVLNDARQAKVGVKIRPVSGGADVKSAKVFMGIVRHIEYISNADAAYQTALKFAVQGGWGYWRLVTEYANDDSFDQELFIRRIKDPLSVYLDPDINEFDGSDAKFAFVSTMLDKKEFELQYPEQAGRAAGGEIGNDAWAAVNKVRVAEYFRRVEVRDRLFAYPNPENPEEMLTTAEEDLPPALAKQLAKLPGTRIRAVKRHKVEWFKIIGNEIVEERDWLGSYIPIVRVIGEETVIDGQLDRKGHVRALKDAQRMFNYNASGSIEFGALQSKTPYIAPADAIEGYEDYWNTANTDNHSILPYNHMDDEGEAIPAPTRQEPPRSAPVFMQGMSDAAEWMRMVSGQYQSDMGAPSNERSGVAIMQRQRQGDQATYHYLDHQSIAIRLCGKMLIELIPKVYDTERVLNLLGDNGQEQKIKIDPNAKQALQEMQEDREEVQAIFNPGVGQYEVESDVGPSFATKRQETVAALTEIIKTNPAMAVVIGDLAVRAMDFDEADEAAARLKRMVPAQALGDGPPPEVLAAQQQVESLQTLIKRLAAQLADKTAAHRNDMDKNAVSAYDAQTKRLAAIKEALNLKPELLMSLVEQVILEAESTSEAGLGPALTPEPTVEPGNLLPPPAPPPGPMGMPPGSGGPAPGMEGAGPAPDNMTAGPAPAAGSQMPA